MTFTVSGGRRNNDATCGTFDEAEQIARLRIRSGGEPSAILDQCGIIAYVRMDALGRVWTDLTPDGARML